MVLVDRDGRDEGEQARMESRLLICVIVIGEVAVSTKRKGQHGGEGQQEGRSHRVSLDIEVTSP